MNRFMVGVFAALLAMGCGKKEDTGKVDKPPAARQPSATKPAPVKPAPAKSSDAAPAKAAKPVDAAPKPFVLTAKECKAAVGRSYALMQRYKPKKMSKKQKKEVADYVDSTLDGASMNTCRRNSRAWYDCKMKAAKHFEAEDCNMIDADDSDGPPP